MSTSSLKFGTTFDYLMLVPEFAARANLIEVPPYEPLRPYGLADQARLFGRVLRAAARERALLLFSSRGKYYPEVLAILALSVLPRRLRPTIVLCGDMWQPNAGWRGRLEALIVRLIDRAIARYAVYSSPELTLFPENWGLEAAKTRFVPYLYTILPGDLLPQTTNDGHVFAGGNPFRDYDALVEAARGLPEQRFILATRRLAGRTDLPANVQAGSLPHPEFMRQLQTAAAVVVPLRAGLRRAAGQQTYLNAMWLGKPTIVNDAVGVRDYIRHGETGLIVDGSPQSYLEAVRWVLHPANADAVRQMGVAARADVEARFSRRSHALRLLEIMDEALAGSPRR